ncbi:uncharacterized protein LTR77_011182 [Saxophila tyrrhenica]|uniref:Inositolphosphotransferase Aur1/Ipt1 domain-containing protein n=1 Tax=Saxophila tyrrhenica TaxID=1690608 RepID=A0AAV9NTD1_9PEZI|nr:hypothetical protein LTR77_011182 [Saxophila tyrrhenica]
MATVGVEAHDQALSMSNNATGQFDALAWLEPLMVLTTMVATLIITRRRDCSVFTATPESSPRRSEDGLLQDKDEYASDSDDSLQLLGRRSPSPGAKQWPSRAPYAIAVFNRILAKFPFLVELFYWILNYAAYRFSKVAAAAFHSRKAGKAVVELAQSHGISILKFEHESPAKAFFFIKEVDVQHFILANHPGVMTVLNQIYSLIHIPGTVLFISWYYYSAPNHSTFAVVRRCMNCANFAAFAVFAIFPCMPPRLLPKSFGFVDTVHQAHAESVWVGDGKSVNQLAAMPSLHFTYALTVGCTFLYHSGLVQRVLQRSNSRERRSLFGMAGFTVAGVLYPMLVLLVIVATANHYYLDAVAATFSVLVCFLGNPFPPASKKKTLTSVFQIGNRVWLLLMPLERLVLRILMLEKPVPTTGESNRRRRRYVRESNRPEDV